MHEDLFLASNRLIFFMLLAFGLSAIAARGLVGIATHVGLMDMPGGRKQHAAPVPVIGGIAMFFGFAAAALGSGLVVGPTLALVAALGLLVVGGVADDMHDITPRTKFVIQLIAALFMTSWALALPALGSATTFLAFSASILTVLTTSWRLPAAWLPLYSGTPASPPPPTNPPRDPRNS